MTMKRILGWTSKKSFLSLGLLLIASTWGVATWRRSQRPRHQAAQLPDMVKQTSQEATAQPDAATKARLNEMYGQLPLSFEANVGQTEDRKSTRLNSSHSQISYAVFCLKKKKKIKKKHT